MNDVKVIRDFISQEDTDFFTNYMDNNPDKFTQYLFMDNPNRYAIMFGNDEVFKEKSNHTLDLVSDIEPKVREYFDKVCTSIKELYNNEKDLYVASWWLARQYKDSFVHPHEDSGSFNKHFKYSTIVYLNNLSSGGQLEFPNLKYTYNPSAREMVSFPSKGSDYVHMVPNIGGDRYSMTYWLTEDPAFAI